LNKSSQGDMIPQCLLKIDKMIRSNPPRNKSKAVFALHGLETEGEWFQEMQRVLEPHFECSLISYQDYYTMGFVKQFADPMVLVPSLIFALVCAFAGLPFWLTLLVLVPLLVFAVSRSIQLRGAVVDRISEELRAACANQSCPHVIAHSFGTYLLGRCIDTSPKESDSADDFLEQANPVLEQDPFEQKVRLSRVVLMGSVLPVRFDWPKARRTGSVQGPVRNEVGTLDLVALSTVLVPWLGPSGILGFHGHSGYHNVLGGVRRCALCERRGNAYLHNVFHFRGHRPQPFMQAYSSDFWLSFFWSLNPLEYHQFLKLARKLMSLPEAGPDYQHALTELGRSTCGLTNVKCLSSAIREMFQKHLEVPLEQEEYITSFTTRAVRLVGQLVTQASDLQETGGATAWQVRTLYPLVAIAVAVDSVLQTDANLG
jgi:hypothetical protein